MMKRKAVRFKAINMATEFTPSRPTFLRTVGDGDKLPNALKKRYELRILVGP